MNLSYWEQVNTPPSHNCMKEEVIYYLPLFVTQSHVYSSILPNRMAVVYFCLCETSCTYSNTTYFHILFMFVSI